MHKVFVTSSKQILKTVLLLLTLCIRGAPCQADELQPTIHTLVEHYRFASPQGAEWEAQKKKLAGYSPEQLVNALISEIDADRGNPSDNKRRNGGALVLFHALDLPPARVIQELDKTQSPERKTALMGMLRYANKPEVVQALLRQLNDYRPVITPEPRPIEFVKPHGFRVRDEAFNALVDQFDDPAPTYIQTYDGNKTREKIIRGNLARLKLTPP